MIKHVQTIFVCLMCKTSFFVTSKNGRFFYLEKNAFFPYYFSVSFPLST